MVDSLPDRRHACAAGNPDCHEGDVMDAIRLNAEYAVTYSPLGARIFAYIDNSLEGISEDPYAGSVVLDDVALCRLAANCNLRGIVDFLIDLASQSDGVAGYHLNGAIAEWDEFPEIDEAAAIIARMIEGD